MKKLLMMAIILGLLGVILIFHLDAAEVEANDSLRVNERKYFTSYVVEKAFRLQVFEINSFRIQEK